MCDLHIHSLYSDSDSTIENIFQAACEKQLTCIAITDHDTIDGNDCACQLACAYDIELLSGIEISAQYSGSEIHILGYGVDTKDVEFNTALNQIKVFRKERILLMADKLTGLGIKIDKEEFIAGLGRSIPTRLHLGKYLVDKSVVKDLKSAFKQYLSPKCPAYVARFKYTVKEAIELIQRCGGVAVLAHPHMLPNQNLIEIFHGYGLDGIEVCYPSFTAERTLKYQNLANQLGLLKSGGSDAHGTYKEYTQVGSITIPYEWVDAIKKKADLRKSNPPVVS